MASSFRTLVIVSGALLIALAAAATALAIRHQRAEEGRERSGASAAPHVEAELRRQREEIAILRTELRALQRSQARMRPSSAPTKPAEGASTELRETHAVSQQRTTQDFEALLARHSAEPHDPVWASQTEAGIDAALDAALRGIETKAPVPRQTDCRRASCRISLQSGDEVDADTLAQVLLLELAGTLQHARVLTLPGADGRPETHIFASK